MDFDGDGRDDILSGSWPGELYLFRRLPDGSFAAAERLRDGEDNLINVGSASAVFAADWNGNGKLDLLVGNIQGHVYFIPNQGTREKPVYGKPQQLEADGRPIAAPGGDAGPVAADWDGDGKLDLLLGTGAGSVLWYRNRGSNEEPELAAAQTLVAEQRREGQQANDADELRIGSRVKICVADFNGNGRLDLLVGDFNSRPVKPPELTAEQEAAKTIAEQQWREVLEEYLARRRELAALDDASEDEDEETDEQLAPLVDRLMKAQEELAKYRPRPYEYHGWVWLLVRKEAAEN